MHQRPKITAGRPWHLWVVGIIGVLWNLMGVASFFLTQLKVEAVMSGYPPQQRAYFESFPWWIVALWALSAFSGLIGCIWLLRRHRLAFHLLLTSAVATITFNLAGLLLLGGLEVMRATDGLGLTTIPIVVTGLLAWYAGAMRENG